MTVREPFVAEFGESVAKAIETAAAEHDRGENKGSDPFKWAIAITIGWECLSKYRECHRIDAPSDRLAQWVRDHGDLGSYDGDIDYLALFAGIYNDFLPEARNGT